VLQQLQKAGLSSNDIDVVFISHFHADHFFGLPFLLLDGRYGGRTSDLTIVGPPGIESRVDGLMALGYERVLEEAKFERHYVEMKDGSSLAIGDIEVTAAEIAHVDELECLAYRAKIAGGRSLVYSGDTTLCDPLVALVEGADVLVLECSPREARVHLSPAGLEEVARHAPDATVIATHLDGVLQREGVIVAQDLERYSV
jgi:ribonuclease BN (tRNA processing enzyme)